jgi:hypothetical protein
MKTMPRDVWLVVVVMELLVDVTKKHVSYKLVDAQMVGTFDERLGDLQLVVVFGLLGGFTLGSLFVVYEWKFSVKTNQFNENSTFSHLNLHCLRLSLLSSPRLQPSCAPLRLVRLSASSRPLVWL